MFLILWFDSQFPSNLFYLLPISFPFEQKFIFMEIIFLRIAKQDSRAGAIFLFCIFFHIKNSLITQYFCGEWFMGSILMCFLLVFWIVIIFFFWWRGENVLPIIVERKGWAVVVAVIKMKCFKDFFWKVKNLLDYEKCVLILITSSNKKYNILSFNENKFFKFLRI